MRIKKFSQFVIDDERVHLQSTSSHACIRIDDLKRKDSSIYELSLQNPSGSNVYPLKLEVIGTNFFDGENVFASTNIIFQHIAFLLQTSQECQLVQFVLVLLNPKRLQLSGRNRKMMAAAKYMATR